MPVPAFPSLSALHAAYADGLSPEAVVAETYRRLYLASRAAPLPMETPAVRP